MAELQAGSEWVSESGYAVRVLSLDAGNGRMACWWEYRGVHSRSETPALAGWETALLTIMERLMPMLDSDADAAGLAGLEV